MTWKVRRIASFKTTIMAHAFDVDQVRGPGHSLTFGRHFPQASLIPGPSPLALGDKGTLEAEQRGKTTSITQSIFAPAFLITAAQRGRSRFTKS
jgi:hypothetical protein